jgi:hypothetical protein
VWKEAGGKITDAMNRSRIVRGEKARRPVFEDPAWATWDISKPVDLKAGISGRLPASGLDCWTVERHRVAERVP